MKFVRYLLLFFPVALAAEIFHWGDLVVFGASALAIIPFVGILAESTEALAEKTGPRIGGLLNASLGNLLFVLGLSLLAGGLKFRNQRFDRERVSTDATLVVYAMLALDFFFLPETL